MWRPSVRLPYRLRLSTLMLLLVIVAEGVALVRERQREARLEKTLRRFEGQYDDAIRETLARSFDPFHNFDPVVLRRWPYKPPTVEDFLIYFGRDTRTFDEGLLRQGFVIGFDSQGIADANASIHTPITLPPIGRKSRGQVLEEVLDRSNLGFYVNNGIMTITSKARAERERRKHPFDY